MTKDVSPPKIDILESKSMANRLLILESFLERPTLELKTQAQDVEDLKLSLINLRKGNDIFYIKDGGTSFRFLLARLSREKGKFRIYISNRLMNRPHLELLETLTFLGCKYRYGKDYIELVSRGWGACTSLSIDCKQSSQFISSLLLSCVNLEYDFKIKMENLNGSLPYFNMTLNILRNSGVKINQKEEVLFITKGQKIKNLSSCELDMSTAFSLAALGSIHTGVKIPHFPLNSLQADFSFVDILKEMGINIKMKKDNLIVLPHIKFNSIAKDLTNSPDLLPVLSVLCALGFGRSILSGVEGTRVKESDRVEKSMELIKFIGSEAYYENGSLVILGHPKNIEDVEPLYYDPDQDHRMAMAGAILKMKGYPITILTPEVVKKSCPRFWEIYEELKVG